MLKKLKGLIVGHMTSVLDNKIAFGKTVEQLIYDVVEKYDYPICFNFSILSESFLELQCFDTSIQACKVCGTSNS